MFYICGYMRNLCLDTMALDSNFWELLGESKEKL